MGKRRSAALVLAPLVLAALGGCGAKEPGEVYPLAADAAMARLETVEVPGFVFGTVGITDLEMEPVVEAADRVTWPIKLKGKELFRYVATVAPVDAANARITVALLPGNARVAKGMADNPDIAKIYQDAMVEAVDAEMERREFQAGAIYPAAAIAVVARFDDINAQFDREIERHDRQVKSNFERAYAEQGMKY